MPNNAFPTYLNVIPFDVLESIAHQLLFDRSGGTNYVGYEDLPAYEDSVSFCKENEVSRQAVLSVLKHRLVLSTCQTFPALWIEELFGSNLRHLNLKHYHADSFPCHFPAMPNLRTAIIHASNVHIQAISLCNGLESLEILADEPNPFREVQFLIGTLASLSNMKSLSLSFSYIEEGHPLRNHVWQKKLAEACPHVENFKFEEELGRVTDFWTLITSLKSLKTLTIGGNEDDRIVAEWRMPFFRSLDEVYFNIGVPIRWALSIGAVVRGVSQYRGACDMSVRHLTNMSQLTQLHLRLSLAIDRTLLSVPLYHMEQLSLDWSPTDAIWNQIAHADQDPIERRYLESWYQARDGERGDYLVYEPIEEVLLDMFRRARNLRSLSLYGCRIKSSTVMRILQIVGSRLEKFNIAIDGEKEPIVTQMTVMLHAIANHCPNIREIWFARRGDYSPTLEEERDCMQAWGRVARSCRNVICSGSIVQDLILCKDE